MAANAVLDLDQIVRDWAWREFDETATKKEQKLRKKDKKSGVNNRGAYIGIQVDWTEVRFRDQTNWARIADVELADDATTLPSGGGGGDQNHAAAAGPKPLLSAGAIAEKSTPQGSVLFQTKFTNSTSDPQEYTMRTEKTTTSTCSTEIESSYTRGMEMSVTLKSPCEIFEANAGYSQEFSLTNFDGQTFEESLTWGVESLIRVKALHEAEASLIVTEKKQQGNFTIQSQISGMVYVTFTDIRDNNSLLKATGHKISEIVKEYLEKQNRKGQPLEFVKVENGIVHVITRGKCNFRYGVRQEVKVKQTKI